MCYYESHCDEEVSLQNDKTQQHDNHHLQGISAILKGEAVFTSQRLLAGLLL